MTSGRAFFLYTGLRLILLLAVGGLLYLTGARGILLVILAFLVSGALSLVWLDRPRAQMSAGVDRALHRVNDRIDAATTAEDDLIDDQGAPQTANDLQDEPETQPESESGKQKS